MSSPDPDTEEAPKKKSKKTLFIILAIIIVLLGGGGAAAFFMKKGHAAPDPKELAKKEEAAKKAARVFVTLDTFVVNLADQDSDRYAQIGLVLEVSDKKNSDLVSASMPVIRNAILLLLSSKRAEELTTRQGKEQLADEIALAAAAPIGWKQPPKPVAKEPDAKPESDAKTAAASEDGHENADKSTSEPPLTPPSNPIHQVHFSSFIVQ